MKLSVTLLALAAALGSALTFSLPAAASILPPLPDEGQTADAKLSALANLLQFADNDSDDDSQAKGDEGDEGMACAGSEEEDDDEGGCVKGKAPAPAGTVAPPNNGLFAPGAAPKVQIN